MENQCGESVRRARRGEEDLVRRDSEHSMGTHVSRNGKDEYGSHLLRVCLRQIRYHHHSPPIALAATSSARTVTPTVRLQSYSCYSMICTPETMRKHSRLAIMTQALE